MKRVLTSALLLFTVLCMQAQITETATEAVKNMGVGWNLGNTLDANYNNADPSSADYWGKQSVDSETWWGQPKTRPELFPMMKKAGFGAIRVPVTWFNHMDATGKVNTEWMKRVHEVVDYVVNAGLYCIINVHHDTGDGQHWLKASEKAYAANKARYEYLWKQIAEEFKDYDQHLLFESFNEMLDEYNSWCFASFAGPGNYNAASATASYNAINAYAQSFVDVVRATGSNNATRNLIVNTYAAACGTGNWNSHLIEPLTQMKLPNDEVKNHIIFEVHSYPQIATKNNSTGVVTNRSMTDIKKDVDELVSKVKTHLASKGAPVIIGEWGTSNVDAGSGKTDYDERRELMLSFADYFVKKMKENHIGTFYWMGLTDGLYRDEPAFSQPDLAEKIAKAYHGSSFQGEYPVPAQKSLIVCFEGSKNLGWGDGISIPGSFFSSIGKDVLLEISYSITASGDDIQFYYGDWSSKPTLSIEGKNYTGDFNPHNLYGNKTGVEHQTIVTFSPDTYEQIAMRGLIIHGSGICLTKAVIYSPEGVGIQDVTSKRTHEVRYDLSGKLISKPMRGIYIKGGRKIAF